MPTPTPYERELIERARAGDYDPFTEHFFRLPYSGTWYTPEDREEEWSVLRHIWELSERPEDELKFRAKHQELSYKVMLGQYGKEPAFLLPHGYRFLPWFRESIESKAQIVVALGGTGRRHT